jgi:hypothetical protein
MCYPHLNPDFFAFPKPELKVEGQRFVMSRWVRPPHNPGLPVRLADTFFKRTTRDYFNTISQFIHTLLKVPAGVLF